MPRRILVATVGATPQVLAETLWVLESDGWLPDEVCVVTTARGRLAVQRAHQAKKLGIREGANLGFLVPQVAGVEVEDINSSEAAKNMANALLRLLEGLTRAEETEIHLSISGGRKTTSAHAALAAALVFRPQDRVSHVLVSPTEFEDNPTFWRPDQIERCHRNETTLDPTTAQVTIVNVPLPLLRYRRSDSGAQLDYDQVVSEVNAVRAGGKLVLSTADNSVTYGDRHVVLSPLYFALLRLAATAQVEQWPGADPDATGPGHFGWIDYGELDNPEGALPRFAQTYVDFIEEATGDVGRGDRTADAIRACFAQLTNGEWRRKPKALYDPPAFKRLMSTHVNRLGIELESKLGPLLAQHICPIQTGRGTAPGNGLRLGLKLPHEDIEIRIG